MMQVYAVMCEHLEYDDNNYYPSGGDVLIAVYAAKEQAELHVQRSNRREGIEAFSDYGYAETMSNWLPHVDKSDENAAEIAKCREIVRRLEDREQDISDDDRELVIKNLCGPHYVQVMDVKEKCTIGES
jgi:hypothetical protein